MKNKINFLEKLLEGVDCIIHAAAIVSHSANKNKMLQTAMDGTANLINIIIATIDKVFHIPVTDIELLSSYYVVAGIFILNVRGLSNVDVPIPSPVTPP